MSIPADVLQVRPVEAVTRNGKLTCEGPDAPCSDDLLLDDSGITLLGPELYGGSYELGELLLTGEDVAQASITETKMGDEEQQGDFWTLNMQLSEEAASIFRSATARAVSNQPPMNQIAMVLNGVIVASPTVMERIEGGQIVIESLSRDQAESPAEQLGLESL